MKNEIGGRGIVGASTPPPAAFLRSCMALFILCPIAAAMGQMGTPTPLPAAERQKAEAGSEAPGALANYPHLADITDSTGIHFKHLSSPEVKFIAESMSGGVASIDYDRDGREDLFLVNGHVYPQVDRAHMRVTAGDPVQLGEVLSAGSYLAQNDLRLHFGLDASEHIDKVEMLWPSGKVETFENLQADHFYQVLEGRGIALAELHRPIVATHP